MVSTTTYKAIPCPRCSDGAVASGLSKKERNLNWGSMVVELPDDTKRQHYALRWAGQQLLKRGWGFATVHGNYGIAKSLWGKILVAEACRHRVSARYIMGKELERKLFAHEGSDELQASTNVFDLIGRYRILVVDECHGMNWKSEWVSAELMRLFDERVRGARDKELLTVLIGQTHPQQWGTNTQVGALLSRSIDGRYALPWSLDKSGDPPPPCLLERPCFCGRGTMKKVGNLVVCNKCGVSREIEMYWPFGLDLPDIRPILPPMAEDNDEEIFAHDRAEAFA